MFIRLLKYSMITFAFSLFIRLIGQEFFPEIVNKESVSWFFLWLTVGSVFFTSFTPIVIAIIDKSMKNRVFIIALSLLLPFVGGFFSYFLIKSNMQTNHK